MTLAHTRTLAHTIQGDGPVVERITRDRAALRAKLVEHGALLLRGFDIGGADGLAAAVRALAGEPLSYTEQSSPRSVIKGNVYTSTSYPAQAEIPLHTEMSYQSKWPLTLFFHCVEPPLTEGATPLASIREVYERIDPDVRAEFERRRWMVVRNYGEDVGLRWWTAFGTEDRAEVERQCAAGGITPEWVGPDGLRTRAVRDAVHKHPVTGLPVWFNHIVIFHESSLSAELREVIADIYGPDGFPNNSYYGDGSVIPDDVVDHLRQCYRAASTRFDYQRDDLLVVDNMAAAHGREPFTGPRKIAVAMAEPSA
ncbi:TauD/TfdA family dioxygenase [Actinokineospora diospyrosa]|uniref:Taurine dioxygenase, alpha-ketoglutarate-dependent n=1 Tax=Actinokineospora diospyrosa TaxID=103728 RepID=A0ABT1IES7_9PSEU|nr:TauD/TfdA family dioxygenase [Actinokineospora diospyrosa]MCP2271147.1 Taurine dioxygenase, alpha-ketoglutarate-dependent [Actinokineospora diospyrosa]